MFIWWRLNEVSHGTNRIWFWSAHLWIGGTNQIFVRRVNPLILNPPGFSFDEKIVTSLYPARFVFDRYVRRSCNDTGLGSDGWVNESFDPAFAVDGSSSWVVEPNAFASADVSLDPWNYSDFRVTRKSVDVLVQPNFLFLHEPCFLWKVNPYILEWPRTWLWRLSRWILWRSPIFVWQVNQSIHETNRIWFWWANPWMLGTSQTFVFPVHQVIHKNNDLYWSVTPFILGASHIFVWRVKEVPWNQQDLLSTC